MPTKLTAGDQDLFELAAAATGGYAGYLWLDVIIPGVGGYWGFAIGAVIFGGLMMALMGTQTGKAWATNVDAALTAMINDPFLAIVNYITALLMFDIAWDYAFEFFDPVFDLLFELIPGGYELWPELNPYGGGFLGASAIIAAFLTIGWYTLISWPQSCAFWMICKMIGGGKHGCIGDKNGFPCPGGFLKYQCPETFKEYWNPKSNTYNLWALPGDLVHIGLIPIAMPLCLAIQAAKKELTGFDVLMFPYHMLSEFVLYVGVLFLDVAYIENTDLKHFGHIFYHLFDQLKCKSWGMRYK